MTTARTSLTTKQKAALEAKKLRFLDQHNGTDPLEKVIEARWNKIAKKCGWTRRKFSSPQQRGVPDDLYFRNGECFLIEFKRLGRKPTPNQQKEHIALRKAGMTVLVIDAIDDVLAYAVFL